MIIPHSFFVSTNLFRFPCCASPASAVVVAPFLVVASLGIDLTTEHVETIAHMEHGVAVNAVVAGIATTVGVDPALVVRLLTQQVVEVQGYDKGLALEEGFGHLTVPDELVCVG